MPRKRPCLLVVLVVFAVLSLSSKALLMETDKVSLWRTYDFSDLFIAASIGTFKNMAIEEVLELKGDVDWEEIAWLLTNGRLTSTELLEDVSEVCWDLALSHNDIQRLRRNGYSYKDILEASKLGEEYGETAQFILQIKGDNSWDKAKEALGERQRQKRAKVVEDQFARLLNEYFNLSMERNMRLSKGHSAKEIVQALYIEEIYGTRAEDILIRKTGESWNEVTQEVTSSR